MQHRKACKGGSLPIERDQLARRHPKRRQRRRRRLSTVQPIACKWCHVVPTWCKAAPHAAGQVYCTAEPIDYSFAPWRSHARELPRVAPLIAWPQCALCRGTAGGPVPLVSLPPTAAQCRWLSPLALPPLRFAYAFRTAQLWQRRARQCALLCAGCGTPRTPRT